MKIEFDPIADALYIALSENDVDRTEEIRPGVILDYDALGNIVGFEMLSVSKQSGKLKHAA
ncbi:DUF2283 domain-containing protein [Methylobacillus sp. Pita2]|uniref:DUF2283 domain-containing protein n=1 Tax=Methylobacillus TaxID=404 RepID=UPI002853DC29|nr:DUF2283 domain-containing protein [Methylobacillus flagellatus]MDR5172276.1 DUF2283 domain-containing protein [Methylobacillus flagellatus]